MNRMCAIDNQEVDPYTMKELRQSVGLDEDDISVDKEILTMSGFEFLNQWLTWNGIIGYTTEILEVIEMAYGVDLREYPFNETIKRTKERF